MRNIKVILLCLLVTNFSFAQKVRNGVKPLLFEEAFLNKGVSLDSIGIFDEFLSTTIGTIKIHSGKLLICDPLHVFHAQAINYTFPKGNFPLQIAFVKDDSSGSPPLISYLRIVFSNESVKEWTLLVDLQKQSLLPNKSGYSAHTESGILLDTLSRKFVNTMSYLQWCKTFVSDINNLDKESSWAAIKIKRDTIFAFNGFNQNWSRIYSGKDKGGNICRLLISTGAYQLSELSY